MPMKKNEFVSPKKAADKQKEERIKYLIRQGLNSSQIMERMGVARDTVNRIMREIGIGPRPRRDSFTDRA